MEKAQTIKLYDDNAYLKEFEAQVVSCNKTEKGTYETVLDKTAFFPEEGGQSCDNGTLDGKQVLHVALKGGIIFHITSEPFDVGETVCGKIDFSPRYRNMQNHSGEHLFSGLVHKAYGYENVGFHLGSQDMTMDYDGELDKEQIEQLEKAANKAIYENVQIVCRYPDKDELESISYRSKLDLLENVRLVAIENYDICACCAPHVKTTGEIGILKVVDFYRYKGGMRIHALCGFDAVCDYISKHNDLKAVSAKLSAKIHEVPAGVDRILEENTKLSIKLSEQSEKIASLIASKVEKTQGMAVVFENGITQNEMRLAANAVVANCAAFLIFSGDDESGYSFIIASEKLSAKDLLEEMKKSFTIKGGGSPKMVQGNTAAKKKDIEEHLLHTTSI